MTKRDEKKALSAGLRAIRDHRDVTAFLNALIQAIGSKEHLVALWAASMISGSPQQRLAGLKSVFSVMQYCEDAERGVSEALKIKPWAAIKER
ncbi:hypothetical protein [Rosistilla ulvae]|uniref:hypothetical protein n=1 Tax=Rosistilla ulvae TaxID=1930277 RepID=UPI0011A1B3E1|nr:hypothetical protein [Rosistilla ulvae]